MGSWKGKWLSFIAKLLMIESVLSVLFVYTISCLKIPKATEEESIKIMRRFFWNGTKDQNKVFLIAWEKNMCTKGS